MEADGVTTIWGVPVVPDEGVPPNVVEIRHRGETVGRVELAAHPLIALGDPDGGGARLEPLRAAMNEARAESLDEPDELAVSPLAGWQPALPEGAKQSVAEHLSLLDQRLVSAYLGAAVARTAARYGKTPRQVVEEALLTGAFDFGDEWPEVAARLGRLERNARATYSSAGVALTPKRPQG